MLEVRILGPLQVLRDGRDTTPTAGRERVLLALLLLRSEMSVPRDVLAEHVWAGRQPRTARQALNNAVAGLRRLLGADRILTSGGGIAVRLEEAELDARVFDDLYARSAAAPDARERAATLGRALSLWRGDVLADVPLDPLEHPEIVRLEELRLAALEARIEADLERGKHAELVPELEELVAKHPFREGLRASLMVALYRSGRQAEALATYRRARVLLVSQLGLEPGPDLQRLERSILMHDAGLADGGRLERMLRTAPSDPAKRAETLYQVAVALWRSGEVQRGEAALVEAIAVAANAGAEGVELKARLQLTMQRAMRAGGALAVELSDVEDVIARADAIGDHGTLAKAWYRWGQIRRELGSATAGLEGIGTSLVYARSAGDNWQERISLIGTVFTLMLGPVPADEALERSRAVLAEAKFGPPGPIGADYACAVLDAYRGDFARAREGYRRGRDAAVGDGLTVWAHLSPRIAVVELLAGNPGAALAELRAAEEVMASTESRRSVALVRAYLARVLVQLERWQEALDLPQPETPPDEVETLVVSLGARARALAHTGQRAESERLALQAVALAEACDWVVLQGDAHLDAAYVFEDPAHAELASAAYERKGNGVGAASAATRS